MMKKIMILSLIFILCSFFVSANTISEGNIVGQLSDDFSLISYPNYASSPNAYGYSELYETQTTIFSELGGQILCRGNSALIYGKNNIMLVNENFTVSDEEISSDICHSGAISSFNTSSTIYAIPRCDRPVITFYNVSNNRIIFLNNITLLGNSSDLEVTQFSGREALVTFTDNGYIQIFNYNGTLFSQKFSAGWEKAREFSEEYIAVGDVDEDGMNDVCFHYYIGDGVACIDEDGSITANFSLSGTMSVNTIKGLLIGDIDGGNQEIIITGISVESGNNFPTLFAFGLNGVIKEKRKHAAACPSAGCFMSAVSNPVAEPIYNYLYWDNYVDNEWCFWGSAEYSSHLSGIECVDNNFDLIESYYTNIATQTKNTRKLWGLDILNDNVPDFFLEGYGTETYGGLWNLQDGLYMPLNTSTQHSAICDLNSDNSVEIIGRFLNNTKIYSSSYINTVGEVTIYTDTGNPICLNNKVKYTSSFDDLENNDYLVGLTCSDGTFVQSDWLAYTESINFSCNHSELGDAIDKFLFIDKGNPVTYTYYNISWTVSNDSSTCYSSGDGGSSTSGNDRNLGEPCTDNSQCISGLCEYGSCAKKGRGLECTLDSDCISGECINNLCKAPSTWDNIDYAVAGGEDSNSKLFIALTIIFVVAGFLIWWGGGVGAIVAVGWVIVSAIFFTIVGWIPAIILFGFVLMAIVFIFLIGIFNK